jgi:hypothetical protein
MSAADASLDVARPVELFAALNDRSIAAPVGADCADLSSLLRFGGPPPALAVLAIPGVIESGAVARSPPALARTLAAAPLRAVALPRVSSKSESA